MDKDSSRWRFIVGNGRDITPREVAAQQVRENEKKYRWLAENASDMVAVFGLDFVPEYLSPNVEEVTGYTCDELKKHVALHFVHIEDVGRLRESVERDMMSGVTEASYEYRFLTRNGRVVWAESRVRFVRDEEGHVSKLVFDARDITQRKEAEFQLRDKQEHLEESLERERLLLHEVHHRIKNDMNLVNSMLRLQSSETAKPEVRTLLEKAANRVAVIAEVYEAMYRSSEFKEVEVKPLVERLAGGFDTGPIASREGLDIECDEFSMPTKEGVSLGIILNELITNAFKYGTDSSRGQLVRAEVRLFDDNKVRLSVGDTGSGFPEHILRGENYGFGLTVVSALTEQHNGELKLSNEHGGVVEVTLPLE